MGPGYERISVPLLQKMRAINGFLFTCLAKTARRAGKEGKKPCGQLRAISLT
jgi:hypothetical protein